MEKGDVGYLDSLLKQNDQIYYWNFPEFQEPIQTWILFHQKINVELFPLKDSISAKTDVFLINKQIGQNELRLNSRNLFVRSVIDLQNEDSLLFSSDSLFLTIQLPKRKFKGDTVIVRVDYSVKEPQKGLHFKSNQQFYTNVSTQIYTDHQPNDIQFWLPTLDSPSQKATVEFWLTVPDSLQTLATGILLQQESKKQNQRTDYWTLNQSQSPYLWGFVVGNSAKSQTIYSKKLVEFHSDKKYAPYHGIMYKNVPEMLRFMEDFTSINYPYDVLKFIPVNEFEAMGMENSGMITLFDGVQFDSSAAIDLSNTDLLIHEIAHQWFGDYVTVNSWSEVALQEGLATWFEYQFAEKNEGELKKNEKKWDNLQIYLEEAKQKRHPIITKNYVSAEDLFDAHSYQKASLVFELLQTEIGDDRFKQVLRDWLNLPADKISASNFQKLIEEQTGISFAGFFKQWFRTAGHPVLSIKKEQTATNTYLHISQGQKIPKEGLFDLAIPITAVSVNGKEKMSIHLSKRDTVIQFSSDYSDFWIDPLQTIPAEIKESISTTDIKKRLNEASFYTKMLTLNSLSTQQLSDEMQELLMKVAKNDESVFVRQYATALLAKFYTVNKFPWFSEMLKSKEDGQVRIYSLFALASDSSKKVDSLLASYLPKEKSYFVQAEIIKIGLQRNGSNWIDVIKPFIKVNSSYEHIIQSAITQGLYGLNDDLTFDILYELAKPNVKRAYIYEALDAINQIQPVDFNRQEKKINLLKQKTDDPDLSVKALVYKALSEYLSEKNWLEEKINSLDEWEAQWINDIISMQPIVNE